MLLLIINIFMTVLMLVRTLYISNKESNNKRNNSPEALYKMEGMLIPLIVTKGTQ
jgi:hypothetical protein